MDRHEGRSDDIPGERAESPGMWRRLEGELVYDSREQRPMVGVRAVAGGSPRLMYRAPGFEIDLLIRPGQAAGRFCLLGQVLGEGFEPCSGSVVLEAAHGVVSTGLDDCGHFSIDGLGAGWHRMEARLPHALIVIRSLHL